MAVTNVVDWQEVTSNRNLLSSGKRVPSGPNAMILPPTSSPFLDTVLENWNYPDIHFTQTDWVAAAWDPALLDYDQLAALRVRRVILTEGISGGNFSRS